MLHENLWDHMFQSTWTCIKWILNEYEIRFLCHRFLFLLLLFPVAFLISCSWNWTQCCTFTIQFYSHSALFVSHALFPRFSFSTTFVRRFVEHFEHVAVNHFYVCLPVLEEGYHFAQIYSVMCDLRYISGIQIPLSMNDKHSHGIHPLEKQ